MRKFLPELIGVAVLLVAAAVAFGLLYTTDSATGMGLALVCLAVMVIDIKAYRMWSALRGGRAAGQDGNPGQ
jgi:hypothetical protein